MIETKKQALGLCIQYERLRSPNRRKQYSAWRDRLDEEMTPLCSLFDLAAAVAEEAGDEALSNRCLKLSLIHI